MYFSYGISLPEILPEWKPITQKTHKLTCFKVFEFCFAKTPYLIEHSITITLINDHPGISISYGLFGFSIELQFYDIRHQEDF